MIALYLMGIALAAAVLLWVVRRQSPVVGVLLAAVAGIPIAAVALSSVLASAWGCTVNESGTTPCLVGGRDAGPLLSDLFVSGWWMLISLPVGGALLLGWFLWRRPPSAPAPGRRRRA